MIIYVGNTNCVAITKINSCVMSKKITKVESVKYIVFIIESSLQRKIDITVIAKKPYMLLNCLSIHGFAQITRKN